MEIETDLPDFSELGKKVIDDARRYAKVYCLNFFKESFQKQGYTNQSFQAWDNRVDPDYRPGGALLVSTSFLLESLQVISGNKYQLVFGSYAPYAEIHNDGGVIKVHITAKSRKFFWYMYKKTKDERWKGMALTKKTMMEIKIPKRQFIGESAVMMQGLEDWLSGYIVKKFQTLK